VVSKIYSKRMAETSKVDLVGVGLNATDLIIPVAEYPKRGSKTEYQGGSMLPGGQVATTVIACQQWGLQTRYVGKLGQDGSAALHYEAFAKAGVETQITTDPGGMSAQSTILVDEGGERTVLCRRDERLMLLPGDLKREWVEQARALHVDGYETEAATLAAGWAREAGVPVIADLDEIYHGVHQLLHKIDYLIVSRDFPCRLMGEADVSIALRAMHKEYGCKLSAATLGEHGVIAWNGREYQTAAAYQVPVVDTTGAGDIFHAGFIYGLLQGWELERLLDFGCAAAALNCTGLGARGRIESVGVIEELMAAGSRYAVPEMAALTKR
jgi:sulfofructose kinase